MKFSCAIFDLDGVIVDTVPLHFSAWKYLFEEKYGMKFDRADYETKVDGKSRLDGVLAVLPNLSSTEAIAAGELKQQRFLQLLEETPPQVFPGTLRLIEELLTKNVILATASSSKNARHILEKVGLSKYFSAIISGHDFKQGKPYPEIFLNAVAALHVPIAECIVFEDAKAGVEAAKSGGFFCVAIDRHGHPENYRLADLVVADLAEVDYHLLVAKFC